MVYGKEIRVGLLAVAGLVVLYFGIKFLRGSDLLSSEAAYYVYYEKVSELERSSVVQMNGVAVGRVGEVALAPLQGNRVRVELLINEDLRLPVGTEAILQGSLLGGQRVAISFPKQEEAGAVGYLQAGDTLQATLRFSLGDDQFNQSIKKTVDLLQVVLADASVSARALSLSLTHIDTLLLVTTEVVLKNQEHINATLNNLSGASVVLRSGLVQLDSLIYETRKGVSSIEFERINNLSKELELLLGNVNRMVTSVQQGEGTIGKLFVDDALHHELKETLMSINVLLEHFNRAPKDFLAPLGRSERRIQKKERARKKRKGNK